MQNIIKSTLLVIAALYQMGVPVWMYAQAFIRHTQGEEITLFANWGNIALGTILFGGLFGSGAVIAYLAFRTIKPKQVEGIIYKGEEALLAARTTEEIVEAIKQVEMEPVLTTDDVIDAYLSLPTPNVSFTYSENTLEVIRCCWVCDAELTADQKDVCSEACASYGDEPLPYEGDGIEDEPDFHTGSYSCIDCGTTVYGHQSYCRCDWQ